MRMELHDKGLILSAPEILGEPSEASSTSLRGPYLFRLAGKDRGEKGTLGYGLVRAAGAISGKS